jgi:anti-sigma factor RsiW
MTIPDETLMAYANNELEPGRRAEVEAAIAADPGLARRVEHHRALRKKRNAALDSSLLETVPNAVVGAVHASPTATRGAATGATITDLRRVRAARAAEARQAASHAQRADAPRRPWTWFEWAAMAASLATGAVIAHLAMRSPEPSRIGTVAGQLVAQADLSQALSTQLASDQPSDAPVQIGATFKSKSGDTCRTFTVKEENLLGGLACRQAGEWRVQVLANAPATHVPPVVVTSVEQQIQGQPLDAAGEVAARARGWN